MSLRSQIKSRIRIDNSRADKLLIRPETKVDGDPLSSRTVHSYKYDIHLSSDFLCCVHTYIHSVNV